MKAKYNCTLSFRSNKSLHLVFIVANLLGTRLHFSTITSTHLDSSSFRSALSITKYFTFSVPYSIPYFDVQLYYFCFLRRQPVAYPRVEVRGMEPLSIFYDKLNFFCFKTNIFWYIGQKSSVSVLLPTIDSTVTYLRFICFIIKKKYRRYQDFI